MKIEALKYAFDAEFKNISTDKSISHRCAIFSLLSDKTSVISDYLEAEDTLNSLKIISALGAKVEKQENSYYITPPKNISSPNKILECGNSGTAMRIFMGLLAGNDGFFVLSGDKYLNERPMKRIADPLVKIGAKIDGRDFANKAPLAIRGTKLKYFEYDSHIPSAQVKTALILAGLCGNGCKFSEPELSRDHSERMLLGMGADIKRDGLSLQINPLNDRKLRPLNLSVPNDPSSCFFYAVAAAITPGAKIKIKNILLNKTRIEAYKILEKMGTKISYNLTSSDYDDIGDISVEYAPLKAVEVTQNISWLIDEAPALAVAFSRASGKSVLRNAKELRVKECDRIAVTVNALKCCGIEASELEDGFEVIGGVPKKASIDSHGDHRIAMSFAVLGLLCGMDIQKSEFIATSFPKFSCFLRSLGANVED
ncbi:3-phosphoshikimate 1-carboxyvinyltransferase [Campylobacter hyointestinalis]|uniref:3-phosphoshikimate 1-carboxyvinyltransferase n=1 Tax=Campylobacter hyointestinalis TaxID=198 RepID=UPI00072A90FE|nr:3-phosphoshikimate 1-carboxyvinyltransferase [Campylobacter hyointestinalis]PPB54591.1 3-phosphoshikimate 1-carboxyvinyltransferase [Campylobacter hyointestinalis subsp. hyointestinalis]CUU88534.1 3-phosphoshikimate 1-carboxyvinyltransferase [Campylobacter hyointestinalis]